MLITEDIYASRVGSQTSIIERQDPIIYSQGQPPTSLNQKQVQFYQDNGFLFIENFFMPQEVAVFIQEIKRLAALEEITSSEKAIIELGSHTIRSIFWVHRLSFLFHKLSCDKRILDIVHYLLNDDVYIHQSRLNFKPAFSGNRFYWHSDFETWHIEDGMPRMRTLSAMIMLAENNEFNGPLMLIPGSHKKYVACVGETPTENYKQSLKQQKYGVPDQASLTQLVEENGIVALKGSAGSIAFFDCNTIHSSNGNLSPYPRSNVFFVYNSLQNSLQKPFNGLTLRPEFIATRENIEPLVSSSNTDYLTHLRKIHR
ncbi:MAG: ectoine hydroxylase [Okeania sp. SIO2D1]|nr:ectoine hydroxylase [Okeania sp. SIO2D1]